MTPDEQKLTERIAREVMGRTHKPADDYDPPCWVNEKGRRMRWCDSDVDGFDPLHDHNHMALAREKMRERGYMRFTNEVWVKNKSGKMSIEAFIFSFCRPPYYAPYNGRNANELHAEALAMLQAVEGERKDGE